MNMGKDLYDLRISRGMTLRDVSEKSGVAFSYIRRLEQQEDWDGVSLGRVAKIAHAFAMQPGDLIGDEYLWRRNP